MVNKFNEFENYFVVDSMPLEVCEISRSTRSKICRKVDYAMSNNGFCASQNLHFYGHKLHAVVLLLNLIQKLKL